VTAIMTSISTNGFYDRSVTSLASLRARAETLQTQIATSERLQRASDDPVAARQLRAIADEDAMAKAYGANAGLVAADLALAGDALTQLTNLTIRAQELATQSANGTLNDDQRKSNGDELAQIHASMVAILNGKSSTGQPLFAGTGDGPAFTLAADGSATYAGTGQPAEIDVGHGISVAGSMTGSDVIAMTVDGNPTDLLSVIHNLATSLQAGGATAADDASNALKALIQGITTLSTGQAVIAARQGRVELATTLEDSRSDMRASEKSRIGATDQTKAIAQLQEVMTVLEASQASFTKLSGLSLFNYLQ
jgi:flagellar hook-associated protein 3 FlgL